jgi:PBP1b-binding outer membrane lipoprotein LpoB
MKKLLFMIIIAALIIGCKSKAKQEAEVLQAKQMTIDSIAKAEDVRKRTIDSMNAVAATKAKQERVVVVHQSASGNGTTTTTTTTKKKGWNSTLKGAVIGAGAGAITGAMVDKKKGRGAVIGGLLGAGAGAGVGAIIDGKEKKKNQ